MTVGTLDKIAKEAGIPVEKIRVRKDNFVTAMLQRGIIVDQNIGMCRFQTQLKDEHLGIRRTKKERASTCLGRQFTFPPGIVKRAENAESRARAALDKKCFLTVYGKFVPITAYRSYKKEEEEAKKEFFEVRDEMCERYDELRAQALEIFKERSKAVLARLRVPPKDPDEFRKSFVNVLYCKIPTREDIHDSFHFDASWEWIPLPSEVQEEALRQQKLRKDMDLLDFETADRKKQLTDMNRMVAEQAAEKKKKAFGQATQFLDETIFKLRSMVYDVVVGARDSIKRNGGKLVGSSSSSIFNLIDKVKELNFYNDQEIDAFVKEIEKVVPHDPEKRSVPKISRVLAEIEANLRDSVRSVEGDIEKEEELCRIIGKDLVGSVRTIE